jgi:hypothetical protein
MKAMGKRSIAAFLRGWLTVLWWLVWLAVAGVVLTTSYVVISGKPVDELMDIPVAVDLNPSSYEITSERLDITGARMSDVEGTLRFTSADTVATLSYLGVALAYFTVLVVVLYQLRKIFRSLAEGEPFSLANAARIRLIGLFVIFGELAHSVVVFLFQYYVKSTFSISGLTITPGVHVDLSSVFGGLVLLVIAEVFHLGARLQEDQDLTV